MEIGGRKFSAVLFDYDGVLGRTAEDNCLAWEHAFAEVGGRIDREEYLLMEGKKSPETARHFLAKNGLPESLAEKVVEIKNRYYAEHNSFYTYPGVEALLEGLKAAGVKLAVVSGGSAERLLSPPSNAILPFFDAVITARDCPISKPAPDPYLAAAAKLGVKPEECLVVENAPLGIEAAKRAGMACVAVCSTVERRHLEGAEWVAGEIAGLTALFSGGITDSFCPRSGDGE